MTVPAAAQTGTADRPVILFVLGMLRSGTSALTRVLSLCGGALPAGKLGADCGNPRGYWEPRKAIVLNQAILHRHGSAIHDPTLRLQEEGAFDAEEKGACIAKIVAFLTTLPAAPLVVIKDLTITLLSGLWFEAARQAGFGIVIVIAVRHPQEVIASLGARFGEFRAGPDLSSALWLKFNLLAERDTRGLPRVFVDYAYLVDDWRREVKRISAGLPIDLSTWDEDAIDEFLTPDLHHQRDCGGPVTEAFGTDWNSTVYETLCAAARDEPLDRSALDRVFEAYRSSERGFRMAFQNVRRLNKINWHVRPSTSKLFLEAVAMFHRRRGTWA
jgi:hypothetical protein